MDPGLSYVKFIQGQRISDVHLGKLEAQVSRWDLHWELGEEGSKPEEFKLPQGITATQDGQIALMDNLNKRVAISSNEGHHRANISVEECEFHVIG